MALFSLARFRDLAFGNGQAPDHPIDDEAAARKLLAGLPAQDPAAALAELTHWVATMNENDSFTPKRRAGILMVLDDAARAYWRVLGAEYLAPGGHPAESRDGDRAILQARFESAAEFAGGYALARLPGEKKSKWVEANYARIALRNMRWLARRLTLANMLQLPDADAIWESVHWLYREAVEHKVERTSLPVFPGDPFPSSVKQEYVRLLLVEIASPGALRGRDVELAFRIAGRVASAAKLETEDLPSAVFAILPKGSKRPVSVKRLGATRSHSMLQLDSSNCLPRLRVALERDAGRDEAETDTLYGGGFTLRERNAMLRRLIEAWGPNPPQRRAQRVRLASTARVLAGFDAVSKVVPLADQGQWTRGGRELGEDLRIQLDDVEEANERAKELAARQNPARLLDASSGGVGIAIRRGDAKWAALGALLAVCVDPGNDWSIGVLRRLSSEGDELRLGTQVLSRKPRLIWFRLETVRRETPWDEALAGHGDFLEHFQRGILLDHGRRLEGGDMLVSPGVVSRGSQLDIPFTSGVQRVRVTAVREAAPGFHRIAFELLALAPYAKEKKKPGPDETRPGYDNW